MVDRYQPTHSRTEYANTQAEWFDDIFKRLDELETLVSIKEAKERAQETILENQPIRQEWNAGYTGPRKDWRPIGDGDKYWANPDGFSVKRDNVPQEVLDKWTNETPRQD